MVRPTSASSTFRMPGIGLSIFVCLLASARLLAAQANTSSGLVGEIRDASGGVLPGATVTATRVATGVGQTAASDSEGRYRLPSLTQGEYRLEVVLEGFQTQARTGLILTVARTLEVNFTLAIGSLAESVTVAGATPLVETQSSSVAGLVSGEQIRALPLNGRSFDQLITLSAGTVMFTQRTTNAFQGTANQFSAGGARANQTRMVMDGSELSGAGGNHTSVNTASGKLLGVEGIQEFQVITNNGDASYGKKPGGQVSIVTRSGTNQFHGSVFGFLRNDAFDARDFFDAEKAVLHQNNNGFALGGPFLKNRSFFFANYEGYQERRGLTLVAVVPTMSVRSGIFPDGTVVKVSPDMAPILALYPVPNGRDFGDGTALASTPAVKDVSDHYFVTRLDHQFSGNQSLFGRYLIQTGLRNDPNDNGIGKFPEVDPFRTQLLTVGYKTTLTAKLLNQVTFSLNRAYNKVDFVPIDGITIPSAMVLVPGQSGPGSIQVQGGQIPNMSGNTTGGTANQTVDRRVFQYSEKLSYAAGAHFLDAGAELHRIESIQSSGVMQRGALRFANLKSLVQGIPNQLTGPLPGSDGTKDWLQTYGAFYLQDAYRVRRRLTLNLGVRWELMSNPRDAQGRTSSQTPDPITLVYPNAPIVTPYVFAENKSGNWAPRLGFAWDVFGDSRMAIRGGFGVFYSQIESEFRRALGPAAPFYNVVTVANPPFPNSGQALANGKLGVPSPSSVQPSPNIPNIEQYNVRIERSIGPSTLLAVAYLGSHGANLGRTTNPQTPPPFTNAQGRLEVQQVLMNPTLGTSGSYYVWDANSSYNALEVEAEKRLSRGLRFKAAFTWSKTIDEGADIISNLVGASAGSSLLTDHTFGRGLAPHDVRRRLSFNWSYELPLGSHDGGIGVVLNGWQLAGVLQLQDGFPFTVTSGVSQPLAAGVNLSRTVGVDLAAGASNNPVLGGPDKYFDPSAFRLAPVLTLGNLGSNTLIGPGVEEVDMSLIKNLRLKGSSGLQVRVDAFNVFNHPNFGVPDNTLYNADGTPRPAAGRITSTTTTGREFQFSLKVTF